jgi:hypothetical protein
MERCCNLEKGDDKGIDKSKNFLWKKLVRKKWWVSMYRERQIKKERKEVVLSGEFGCTK